MRKEIYIMFNRINVYNLIEFYRKIKSKNIYENFYKL